ncbi:DUF4174 domain-containing protein [Sulfitobacter donghicola]|uniref:DUF4174 domain-containing protein n=1 Tax=Sulfitobacter donghicola DSW-25 = KCTC 12864 = JCM 14565 TaxID=1300350 RepID=A0A073IJH4_9RHOB|nr:DUF4174 domain-containing protein [Sulfitobacter donghicola]KEJ89919.1 hypothetical protein DSW25_06815 [Sulfitobacter donghicola DSW-25 = KCTC 12864 = JCM 14565]KIN66956.1 DUF4174 domain containing protein [Sulfitobacter donghicola DSW-25 = KCTC 12864 = JCM 14565]
MKSLLGVVFIAVFANTVQAETPLPAEFSASIREATETDLNEFKWKKRPVVVLADSKDDPAFIEQMELLNSGAADLNERDVVVIVDTTPEARSATRLKMRPRGFMLVLVGKDGNVKLRKPFPWDVREITRSIDKMPVRQREIREGKGAAE